MATFLTFCVLLTVFGSTVIWAEADKSEHRTLRRQKRNWIIPPRKLYENVDYTRESFIAKIRSDQETRQDIVYSLIGPGVDQGLFFVDSKNGYVKIKGMLDREKTPFYDLKGRATFINGTAAEKDIDLKIIVLDRNDNPPVFKTEVKGFVNELSDEGVHVISITAIDADEPDTLYTKIAYDIIQQEPAGQMMFNVERSSGEIKVRLKTLDREKQETYKLLITGTDMNGIMSDENNIPMTGTGTVIITVGDVNDHVPELEKRFYECSVEENIKNKEVIWIDVVDKDKIYTENWEAVFTIISGNEAGYFNISTDHKTNKGVLMVTKELDFEELKEVNLKVLVKNKASYHKSVVIAEPLEYHIKIRVLNVPEAPHFHPAVKVVYVSEDKTTIDLKKAITIYKATDSDTLLTATNVKYVKAEDKDNWVSINENTAEIRLNKYPDRESNYLINGTYYVKIFAITDGFTPKTATGTVAIQVEDFNDHCPILTSSVQTMCYGKSSVFVTATDSDNFPNAEPFEFILLTKDTKEKWSLNYLNATSVILSSPEILWPGRYSVELKVKDQQGKFCEVQALQVSVCTCTEAQVCQPARQTGRGILLGAGGVLALLLGILLLFLIPIILLLCECEGPVIFGSFQAFPYEQKQQLMDYHTEGQGEDKELVVLTKTPVKVDVDSSGNLEDGWETREDWRKYGWESQDEYINQQWRKHAKYLEKNATGIRGHSEFLNGSTLESMALPRAFLSKYYASKPLEMADDEASANQMLVSNYEDCLSLTGSLDDLSSFLHQDNNLDFLNDLGPSFKRLAEICSGSAIKLDVSSTSRPAETISASSQVGVKVEGATGGVHKEATSVSASSSTSTTKITTSNYRENKSSVSATSGASAGQTLLIQQPTVYLSSTPMYVVEQQPQPALLLASGPIMGVQEQNMILVEERASDVVIAAPNTLSQLGLQQASGTVLVDPGIRGTVMHGFSGHAKPQGTGTIRVVESRRVESMEPVHAMESSSRATIRKSQNMQANEQSRGSSALESTLGFPGTLSSSQKDAGLFSRQIGGTRKEVREESVSMVKKSIQTSATS